MEHIKIPKIYNVRMLDKYVPKKSFTGTLFVTPANVIFADPENKKQIWILHSHIATLEKLPLSTSGSPLLIRCKTFLSVTFIIPKERDCHEIYTSLAQLSLPSKISELYCYRYTSSSEDIPRSAGWNFFDLQAEYQRMRVPNDNWIMSLINQGYALCESYPQILYVPSSATPSILIGSSKFRSKGRLPVLTYLHKNKAVICRCSQPLSGFSARCVEDEGLLNCILKTNDNSSYMYVVDTRPRINAFANKAAGRGYENENFYENIKFSFWGIENIHIMRSSLQKLTETCDQKMPSMSGFLNGIENSGWLRHIKSILETSSFIANAVDSGISVVVHCSDGWDRTSQVCSLAMLLLDPYYRTLQGFQALIEKDWLLFGHKFTDRVGHLAGDPKEISPIFTQFVECTWQLMQQFPPFFQFNEKFLLTLHENISSCEYGTFIGNSEKERKELRLSEETFSLWGYMANHTKEYINPLYKKEENCGLIKPILFPQSLKFWRSMYLRFEEGVHPRETLGDLLLTATDHATSLNEHIKFLQKKIVNLKNLLSKQGLTKDKRPEKKSLAHFSANNKILDPLMNQEDILKHLSYPEEDRMSKSAKDSTNENNRVSNGAHMIALDWKLLRNIKKCSCSTPFDDFSRKEHCWQCGDVFCDRCIYKHIALPGHVSQCAVPVCRPCYRLITSNSDQLLQ